MLYDKLIAGDIDKITFEKRYIRKDKKIIWVIVSTILTLDNDNKPQYFITQLVDITERKKHEERYKAISNAIPDLVFRLNDQGVYLDFKAEEKNLHYQSEDIIGKLNRDITPPEFADMVDLQIHNTLEAGKTQTFEYELFVPGTGIHYYNARMVASGKEEEIVFSRDITEQRQMENEKDVLTYSLNERVKELTCLFTIASIFETDDILSGEMFNQIVKAIPLGWQYPEICCARMIIDKDEYKTTNYKETIWKQSTDIKINDKKSGSIEVFYLEERVKIDEGPFLKEERNLLNLIAERLGHVIGRRQTEEALRISENRYNAIFNTSLELVYIFDLKGKILEVNDQALNLFGYSPEESKKLKLSDIIDPVDLPTVFKNIEYVVANGVNQGWQEYRLRTNDGEELFIETTAVRLDKDGKPYAIMGIARDITERKLAEEELQFKNTILKTQQETSIDGILIVNEDGKIISYNQRFVEMWGVSQELIENNADEPILEFVTNKVADSRSFYNRIKYLYDHKDETSREEIVLKNGLIFDRYSAPMLGTDKQYYGRIWYFMDITDLKKTEANLSTAAEIAKLGYWEYDVSSGNFIFNEQYYRLIHGSSTEKQGGNIMSAEVFAKNLVHPDDAIKVGKSLQEAIKSPDADYKGIQEVRVLRDNNDITDVSVQFMVQKDSSGNPVKVYGINQDITERKKKEKELIEAKEKAEVMNRLKTNFLANMSHELRTPLIGILGYSEFLINELKDKDLIEMVNTIKLSGQRLNSTFNNILDISRVESEKLQINKKELDLIKYLAEQLKLLNTLAEEKGLSLNFETREESLNAFVDPEMFSSIITNLLNNAIKFTQKGKITLRVLKQGKNAVIEVEDTGIGVPEDLQEIIFNPFRQASEGYSRGYQGAGLGLTIAKKFIGLLGGTITIRSKPGTGSTFILEFPLMGNNVEKVISTNWI